jgi:hypothetical protein
MLGGTWGLGAEVSYSATGVRIVAAAVVLLLIAAVLVVLARVGFWQQAIVSDGVIRFFAWALAAFFLGHALVSFAEGVAGMEVEWWLYGPSGLVIGLLALVVAGSGGAWRIHRPHRTLPSH